MKFKILIAGFAAMTTLAVGATSLALIDVNQTPMSLERLVEIFKMHPEVQTLDQVPATLPNDFLMNFVLKHGVLRKGENGHLNETKVSQSADPFAPRAIIFDERTGFTVSYNGGGEKQTANQRLDTLSFDPVAKRFSLQKIDFPISNGQATPGLSDCKSCHGPQMRPIFAMYPDWPSFYGSVNDELTGPEPVEKLEFADYRSFLKNVASHHPRYSPLYSSARIQKYLGRDLYASYPYRPDVSTKTVDVSRSFAFRPALRLGIVYNRLLSQSLMKQISEHARYKEFAPYFMFNLLQCSWPASEKNTMNVWLKKAEAVLKSKPKTLSGGLLDYRQNLALFDLKINDVDLRYSYNHEGFKNQDASKSVMEVGYIGRYFNAYFDGSATIDELLSAAIYKDFARTDSRFTNLVKPWGLVAKYGHLTARFNYDAEFFRTMDALGEWIEMPYPKQLSAIHHRETFQPAFETDYRKLCDTLVTKLN